MSKQKNEFRVDLVKLPLKDGDKIIFVPNDNGKWVVHKYVKPNYKPPTHLPLRPDRRKNKTP